MQSVPTVYSWLSGGNTVTNTPALVDDHIIQAAHVKLKEAVRRNFEEPKAHLQSFYERYNYIVNGDAESEIKKFMASKHTFEEYTEVS
ncbi:DNAH12 [Bugula neritina]|uniref:DNAH12 n=1 Tax=Bugula neritina TaxID=10212 RepID=A0A7J7KSA4_BUGNE|nr:DNAH12 [Bugula neritina]